MLGVSSLVVDQGEGDVGLGAEVEELDLTRPRGDAEDLGAPPVVAALPDDGRLGGFFQAVRPGGDRGDVLEGEGIFVLPDVLGKNRDAAPNAYRRERLRGRSGTAGLVR